MNLKARIKRRAAHKEAVANQIAVALLNNLGAFPDQGTPTMSCVSSDRLFEQKYAEAQKGVDSKELEFMASQSAIMIANALNSVDIQRRRNMGYKDFFMVNGYEQVITSTGQYGSPPEANFTVEELYQAIAERIKSEIGVESK